MIKKQNISQVFSEENLHKTLVENINDGLIMLEANEVIRFVNTRFCKIVGYSKKELIGKEVYKILQHDKQSEQAVTTAIKQRKKGESSKYEIKIKHKKGHWIWITMNGNPLLEKNGKVIGSMGLVTDITEKKQIEKQLAHNEREYRTLVDHMSEGIVRVDNDERIQYVNDRFCEMFKYSRKELIGKIAHHLLSSSEFHDNVENAQKQRQKGRSSKYEILAIKKGGEKFWCLISGAPLKDYEGHIVGSIGICTDIHNRKIFEQKLKQSEEQYRTLIENATDAIIVLDVEKNKFVEANKNATQLFGYSKEELLKLNPKKVSPKKQPSASTSNQELNAAIKRALKGKQQTFEWVHKNKKGNQFPCEVRLALYSDKTNKLLRVSITDISRRKSQELAIIENEQRFRSLVESTFEGVIILQNGIIIEANYNFAKMFGYTKKEILNKKLQEVADKKWVSTINDVTKKQFEGYYEITGLHRSGTKLEIEASAKNCEYKGMPARIIAFRDITERKQAEIALRESEERYRTLIETVPSGIEHTDVNGTILYGSPSLHKIYDLKNGQLHGKTVFDFFVDKGAIARLKKELKRVTVGQPKPTPFFGKNITGKGRIIFVQIDWNYIRDSEGKVVGFTSVITDITDHRRAEKERIRAEIAEETAKGLEKEIMERMKIENQLLQNEKFTRLIIESSLDMICATDVEGNITEFNTAAQKSFGYNLGEIQRKGLEVLYADQKERVNITQELLEGKGQFSGEVINKRKNGEEFVSFLAASIMKNDKGEAIGMMGISRDITQIKKDHQAVLQSEERYRALYNQAYVGISRLSMSGKFLQTNQQLCDMLGYSEGELIEKTLFEITHQDDKEINQVRLEKFIEHKLSKVAFEKRYIHKNGKTITTNATIALVKGSDRSEDYLVAVFEDITERKKQDQELRESLHEKEILLKEVHHRVKNNLQVISSILNLQSSYVKDLETLEILKESQNRIKSMSFIHERLYMANDFSNINFSEYIYSLSHNLVHSYQIVGNVIDLSLDMGQVMLNLDQAIPCGLIVNELVTNSIKHAFPNNSQGKITVKLSETAKKVSILVSDNGVGLPKKMDIEKNESLGMQLVTTLVEQIDGKMKVTSVEGTKTTITFTKLE